MLIQILTNKYFIGFVVAIAAVLAVLAYGANQYDKGFAARDLLAQTEMSNLKEQLANEASEKLRKSAEAAKAASDYQQKQITELQTENDKLEEITKANENEANNDTNSNRIGLDSSSVLRLNKIK